MSPVFRRLAEYEPPAGLVDPPVPSIPRPRWHPPAEPVPPPLNANELVRHVLEVLDGRRPIAQLTMLTSDRPLLGKLRERTEVRTTQLIHARARHPVHHAAEIFGTARRDDRVLAIAARANWHDGRWWLDEFDVLG